MGPLAVAALLALAPPARAGDPLDGPRSGDYCGRIPRDQLNAIVARVARAAGLEWEVNSGRDPGTGRGVRFLYDSSHRFVRYDCEARRPIEGPSIANTVNCDDLVLVFGFGICEAGRGEAEIAFVAAHEIAHIVLGHPDAQRAYIQGVFDSWSGSALGRGEIRRVHRELGRGAGREAVEAAVWRRFREQSREVIERFQRDQETAADQEAINLHGLAGYDRSRAGDMMVHTGELSSAAALAASTRHPSRALRESLVRAIARELSGEPGVSR